MREPKRSRTSLPPGGVARDYAMTGGDKSELTGYVRAVLKAVPLPSILYNIPGRCIVDLSADYRFDDAWTYGILQIGRAHV